MSAAAFGQAAADPPAFDVASVKASANQGRVSGDFKNGRVTITNATLGSLISGAYGIPGNTIQGAPSWLDADQFDVAAITDPKTSEDDSRLMLRTLLAERFKLKVHIEDQVLEVYALTVAKGGPKMGASASPDRSGCQGFVPLTCHKIGMPGMAMMLPTLSRDIDLPVTDLTGLKGFYDFKLSWKRTVDPADLGPTIFEALEEQLGLKLEAGKHPIDHLVIDHVERVPTGN
jgi:uncharacterized protein (TIGR03435 family)